MIDITQVKKPIYKQTFPTKEKQYRLNKATGELVELPDLIDIQDLVMSSYETTFDVVLAKFLDNDNEVFDDTAHFQDTFDSLQETSMVLDDVKAEFDLPESYSLDDVKAFLVSKLNEKSKQGGDDVEKKDKIVETS